MGGKSMEGSPEQKRQAAREAREEGKSPSEVGRTTGASQQRTQAGDDMTHQQRLDLQREGKPDVISENTPEARPGSRDPDTADRDEPRL
jgi:transposase-like protein